MHPAALPVEKLLADCDVRRTRRSGPGGQHRNKVETAVVLTHRPTGTIAEANERRSQDENRRVALFRLRLRLALDIRRPIPTPYVPSSLWQSRRQGERMIVNPEHDDFPTLLAEALDVLFAARRQPALAAEWLGITTSQLTKFLQRGGVNVLSREFRQEERPANELPADE